MMAVDKCQGLEVSHRGLRGLGWYAITISIGHDWIRIRSGAGPLPANLPREQVDRIRPGRRRFPVYPSLLKHGRWLALWFDFWSADRTGIA
jgi:hypothetical protein